MVNFARDGITFLLKVPNLEELVFTSWKWGPRFTFGIYFLGRDRKHANYRQPKDRGTGLRVSGMETSATQISEGQADFSCFALREPRQVYSEGMSAKLECNRQ